MALSTQADTNRLQGSKVQPKQRRGCTAMSIEAMKQALEALERSVATCFDQHAHQQAMSRPDHFINQAITSLRQAITEASENGLYREGYRNGYGFGEAAGKRQAIAEAEKQDHIRDATKMVEQEPVAWIDDEGEFQWIKKIDNPEHTAFYTHPQPNVTTSDMKQEYVAKTAKQRHEENT